ncbi:MAG: CHASE2 domain-containing protein [Burkholderiaceae bacterium]|jgi:adenylate cyclase
MRTQTRVDPAIALRPGVRTSYAILAGGLLLSIVLGVLIALQSSAVTWLDRHFLDLFVRMSASGDQAAHVAVVDIDDRSLDAVGQWPWPRYRLAQLVSAVHDGKPAAIGLDVLLSEPDRTSLDNVRKSFKHDFGIDLSIAGAPPALTDNDGYLGSVLAETNTVGSKYLAFDGIGPQADEPSGITLSAGRDLLRLPSANWTLQSTERIASQLKYTGFLNESPDRDGMIRRIPLLIEHHGQVELHLALATYLRSRGLRSISVTSDRDGLLLIAGERKIPITEQGVALIRFEGPAQNIATVSAVDLLSGTVSSSILNQRIVFVGSTAAGLDDLHSTVFDPQFPGLKILATVANNLADGRFLREPKWAPWAILLECLVAGTLLSVLFAFSSGPLPIALGVAGVLGTCVGISATLLLPVGLFVSPAACVMQTIVQFMVLSTARLAVERRHAYVSYRSLANARHVTMESMAAVAETRDPETGAHIKRTQHYVKAIALKLRDGGHYSQTLTDEYIELLFHSAPLHDIGKVGVPDNILLKPGRLTGPEFELMKRHATFGKEILESSARSLVGDNFLMLAGEIASSHHEKWDGSGYPLGLAGQSIPLAGRIMSVADVYDALISRRCYKEPFPHAMAKELMRAERALAFDPVVLDAFFAIEDRILEIAATFQDEPEADRETESTPSPRLALHPDALSQ